MKNPVIAGTILWLVGLGWCTAPALSQELPSERSAVISLASRVIDTRTVAVIPKHLDVFAARAGAEEYVLVKFPRPVTAAQLDALVRRTERVYTYLPHDAFLVKIPAARQHRLVDAELGASWSGPYHPAYKISPAVAAVEPAGAAAQAENRLQVLLHVYPDAPLDDLVAALGRLGGEVVGTRHKDRFSRVRLLMTAAQLAAARDELARRTEVFFLDLEARRVLLNDTTVWVGQSGTSGGQQTPVHDRGIFGQGQIVGIVDTGIDADMCYFRDPALGLPPVNACDGGTVVDMSQRKVIAVDFLWSNECAGGIASNEWDTHDHGTHVAGTVAGDDLANPLAHDPGDGMAPGAKLIMQDGGIQTDNCADLPGLGCPVVDLNPIFQQAYDQGARIHTNSWGDDENNPNGGLYSAGSEDADQFMWNNKDFLLLFAAGNSGPGSVSVLSPSTGKNVVAVGATLRGTSAESMASFSSCGPTADGRIKPDITMPGSSIVSANADNNTGSFNCNTRSMSGTSMASPGAAGAAALVREYFTAGWSPSGSATPADAFTPSAALLKAVLVNSGHDMSGVSAIPSGCQGWGRVLLDDVLHFTGDARQLFAEDDAAGFAQGSSGEERTFVLTVGPAEALEVTLTWTDFPSTPAASPNLVNDLDLTVSGPGGTWLGNVFAGGESSTGGSADRLDTVEQVLLTSPTAGSYTVTVRSFNVPNGPQPFALVVTGDVDTGCTVDPDCDDGLFCNGAETCAAGTCEAGTPVACDDGAFCNGAETCNEAADSCDPGTAPCDPGTETCDEGTDTCEPIGCTLDSECNDGLFCNGAETCDVPSGDCQAGTAPVCDDGAFCNGSETCNEATDSCDTGTPPTCDDGAFCNGTETCNEAIDSCDPGTPIVCEDGLFCNGLETCNEGTDSCDAGTAPCTGSQTCDEAGDVCLGGDPVLWMSFRSNTAVPGVGTVTDEDIVSYDEGTGLWALEFDGSDVGLGSFEIDGLAILPSGDLLLSFRQAGTVGGVSTDDSDVVQFTPTSLGATTAGTFSLYFDGSDVGLSSNGEDVDGITLDAGGNLIVSTQGSFSGTGASGADEDLFLFTGTLGSSTSGSFIQHFDGSDVGLGGNSGEDVDAAALTETGELLFSTVGDFSVTGAAGSDEDVVEFSGTFGSSTSGTFTMRLDLSTLGIATGEDIGSLAIVVGGSGI